MSEQPEIRALSMGALLSLARGIKKMSLKAAAGAAGISAAYLHKLEHGKVKNPSPHVLYALAKVLDIPYPKLMETAGYIIPAGDQERANPGSVIEHVLRNEVLSDDEAEALARYLSWHRSSYRS